MEMKTLADMGVSNFKEISRYSVVHKNPKSDELLIYYKRKEGSFLPVCRTYEFGRALQTKVGDSGSPRFDSHYEISPILQGAIAELDYLLSQKQNSNDVKVMLLSKLDELQDVADSIQNDSTVLEAVEKLRQCINAVK